jgi:GxxExxY protein
MEMDEITGAIISAAMGIHIGLGPGLLESVYERVLAKVLTDKGFSVETQKPISFVFNGLHFSEGFRCDLLVNQTVVVELKSVEKMIPVYKKQLLTYLRLMNLEVGLLINFGSATLKEGLERVVNHHQPKESSLLRVNRMSGEIS